MPENRKPQATPPEAHNDLRLTEPHEKAAGIPGVLAALNYAGGETGVIQGLRNLLRANQKGGFDCPSCAWPDPDDERSSVAEYCENGAKAIADESTKKRVTPEFFAQHDIHFLARQSDYWLNQQGRLTHPMLLRKGSTHYEKISWENAFARIAKQLKSTESPHEAVFYTSGRTSNEAAFLYQLLVRRFGTNNLPDCSNMCHESSGVGLSETVGIGKGSVTLDDFYEAEVIMVMGQNPGTNHPRMLSALKKCKDNGGKVISINPLYEAGLKRFTHPQSPSEILKGGTAISDLHLPVSLNGDMALLKALMLLLFEAEKNKPGQVLDAGFIAEFTKGFEAFKEDLQKEKLDDLIRASGVPEERVRKLAGWLAQSKKIIICWAMGITQHKNGVYTIREIVNLLLMKGAIGKPGAGTCPVRGHSNVQGDRTMGIWEKPKQGFLDALEKRFHFTPPQEHGYDTVEAIQAMHEGKVKVFFAMGGNFLSATPDTHYTAAALQKCALTVQVSTKLNRSHLITGEEALILPCLGRTERDVQPSGDQFVSVENSTGVVHSSQGTLKPASDFLLSEPRIVAELGKALFGNTEQLHWEKMASNYDHIREAIEACIPGFDKYNERVRKKGGFYLPNGARERKFSTPDGKAHFSVNELPKMEIPEGHFWMMTIRSHDQFNTTIYGLDDRYRGIFNERRVVLMSREDMEAQNLKTKQIVDLTSHFEGEERHSRSYLVVPYDMPRGCVATYFPEANELIPVRSFADRSQTPTSKSVQVSISPSTL